MTSNITSVSSLIHSFIISLKVLSWSILRWTWQPTDVLLPKTHGNFPGAKIRYEVNCCSTVVPYLYRIYFNLCAQFELCYLELFIICWGSEKLPYVNVPIPGVLVTDLHIPYISISSTATNGLIAKTSTNFLGSKISIEMRWSNLDLIWSKKEMAMICPTYQKKMHHDMLSFFSSLYRDGTIEFCFLYNEN